MGHYNLRTATVLIRSFLPINPFYTNFLVERKDFTSKEISNKIAPFYFYSSLTIMTLVIYKNIIHIFGIDKSQTALSAFYILNLIFVMNIKQRSFSMARTAYFVSGFISTYDMVLRFYIAETKVGPETSDKKSSLQSLYRAFVCSLSCLVGQEIVLKTGSYEINLIISAAFQLIGLLISVYTMSTNKPTELYKNLEFGTIAKSLTMKIVCAFLAGMICNCYSIFIKLFIHNIFRETNAKSEGNDILTKNNLGADQSSVSTHVDMGKSDKETGNDEPKEGKTDESILGGNSRSDNITTENMKFTKSRYFYLQKWNNMLIAIVYAPVVLLSEILISIVSFFFPAYSKHAHKRSVEYASKSGILDAFVSFFCYFISDLIIGYSPKEFKQECYIGSLFVSSFSLFIMTYMKNRIVLAFLYLSTSIFSKTASCYTKNFIVTPELEKNLVSYSCLVESLLHVGINKVCSIYKVNSIVKARTYGIIGLMIFLLIASIKFMGLNS